MSQITPKVNAALPNPRPTRLAAYRIRRYWHSNIRAKATAPASDGESPSPHATTVATKKAEVIVHIDPTENPSANRMKPTRATIKSRRPASNVMSKPELMEGSTTW